MLGIFSLAGLWSLGLEEAEDIEEEEKLEPIVEVWLRRPPPETPAPVPVLSPGPRPLLRFLPGIGKGVVEAGLLSELCLLSGAKVKTRLWLKHTNSVVRILQAKTSRNEWLLATIQEKGKCTGTEKLSTVIGLPWQQISRICYPCQLCLKKKTANRSRASFPVWTWKPQR